MLGQLKSKREPPMATHGIMGASETPMIPCRFNARRLQSFDELAIVQRLFRRNQELIDIGSGHRCAHEERPAPSSDDSPHRHGEPKCVHLKLVASAVGFKVYDLGPGSNGGR